MKLAKLSVSQYLNHRIEKNKGRNVLKTKFQRFHRIYKRNLNIIKKRYWILSLIVFLVVGGIVCSSALKNPKGQLSTLSSLKRIDQVPIPHFTFNKNDIRNLISTFSFKTLSKKKIKMNVKGQSLQIETTLNPSLQNYLHNAMQTRWARYIGIVVMDAWSGQVFAMVGYDHYQPWKNPCIDTAYPSASLFKIITSAAAVEKLDYNPQSTICFNGRQHTLYRFQLRERRNRWTRRISLRDSFARSINPVFGKIGANYLGREKLLEYSARFGFNQRISFDLPVAMSHVKINPYNHYQWAEIASGFNRETSITPLHAALIASSVVNRGELPEPFMVEKVTNNKGKLLYKPYLKAKRKIISPRTAAIINDLMRATISSGTCRKTFRGYRRDKILSKLNIGGKTGSICNKSRTAKFDWFLGFAEEKEGLEKIAVATVVAHEKYIGKRASYYARLAMKQYFKTYFSHSKVLLASSKH